MTPTELRVARARLNLSQAAAAEIIGAKRVTWCRWETGRRKMTREQWELFLHRTGLEKLPFKKHRE